MCIVKFLNNSHLQGTSSVLKSGHLFVWFVLKNIKRLYKSVLKLEIMNYELNIMVKNER